MTVSGAIVNTTGAETGVTANGIPATVSGSRFIANHVPLAEGPNTITITATDVNGLTANASRTVTATPGNYLRIATNVESGTAPLDISISLNASFTITTPTVTISGPVTVLPVAGTTATEFTASLPVEGTYTITASAVGTDSQTYSDTVIVTVMSHQNGGLLLKNKWLNMKQRIAVNDVEGTVGFIASRSQAKYRQIFTALGTQFSLANNYLNNIELVYMADGIAKCRLYRDKVIMGVTHSVEYVVYFVLENGIWKLNQF